MLRSSIVIDSYAVLEDLKIKGGGWGVIISEFSNVEIRRCLIVDATQRTILLPGNGGIGVHGVIEENVLRTTAFNGIQVDSAEGMTIRANVVEAQTGIQVGSGAGVSIVDNQLYPNGEESTVVYTGIFASTGDSFSGCEIARNEVMGNGLGLVDDGITLWNADYCRVTDNIVRGFTGSGIGLVTATGNILERNSFQANSQNGIRFHPGSSDNRYGRNSAKGNAGGCSNPGIPTCGAPDLCDEGTGNLSFGDNLVPGPPPC